ncbi:MAG: PorT family protein [Bacteroidia bacterium]
MKMKNVAILVLGLLLSHNSFAQEKSNEFKFGLKGSMNIGWIAPNSKSVERVGTNIGFSYGPMADYYFKPNYAVSMELLISQINGGIMINSDQIFLSDSTATVVNGLTYTYKNQYVEIPLSLKFRTKEIGYMTYWANFGVAPAFLINAKASITGTLPTDISLLDPTDYKTNDNEGDAFTTNNFDDQVFLARVPLIIGGGIEYKMAGSTSIYAGVRFNNSFSDMFVKDKSISAQNNYFSINAGVFF